MERSENDKLIYKYLVPSKMLYFTLYGSIGAFLPFINLFFISSSLSIQQAGLIMGIRYFFAAVSMVAFGMLSDYWQNKRRLTIFLATAASALIFTLPWVAYFVRKAYDIKLVYFVNKMNDSCTHAMNVTEQLNFDFKNLTNFTNLQLSQVKNCFDDVSSTDSSQTFSHPNNFELFMSVLVVSCAYSIMAIPVNGFIDALVIQEVNHMKPRAVYGHQRVFSPVGFMMFSFISGVVVDVFPESMYMSKYSAIYLVNLFINIVMIISLYFHHSHDEKRNTKQRPWKYLFKHVKNFTTIMLLLTIFHCGMANFMIIGFLGVLLEEIGASKTTIGIVISTTALAELLAFFFSDKLKKTFKGTFVCFALATTSYAIRLFLFSIFRNPYLFIPAQLLQAFGFALFWAVTVEYVEKSTPPEIRMTMFNLMHLCYFSAGGITASIGGGTLYKYYGGRKLFMITSVVCGLWSVVLVFYNFVKVRRHSEESETQAKEESILLKS